MALEQCEALAADSCFPRDVVKNKTRAKKPEYWT